MTPLTITDFPAFFREVHGVEPYPWQQRLLARVVEAGGWPDTLDLPTGAGKTASLDVAVFALALDADRPLAERRQPRRVVLVVDRRTIVDQSHARASRLASALEEPTAHTVTARVAEALLRLTAPGSAEVGPAAPLLARVLRGGMVRDDAWARRPDQPMLISSTVDQVGSRLLFRGYGVSASMRPVHAGLLGHDTLWLLDEVHLSRPFEETLAALGGRYRAWRHVSLPDRWQIVRLSATPRPGTTAPAQPFGLGADDRATPSLARRLTASKPVTLVAVPVHGTEARKRATFVVALVDSAVRIAAPGRTVGVVVNRVDTARDTALALARAGHRTLLVTGRMRPLDRAEVDAELLRVAGPERTSVPDGEPVLVVATQCIEAGADLDFDGLVTECASLDALRQRFGRLDRTGTRGPAQAVVLARADAVEEGSDDPIYGPALSRTWAWLHASAPVDFGPAAFPALAPSAAADLFPPSPEAPILLPAHLDGWAQTAPAPDPDAAVAPWLHGPAAPRPEVQVVWRADLLPSDLGSAEAPLDAEALERLAAWIGAAPPSSLESVSVPLHVAQSWLSGVEADLVDLVGRELDVPEATTALPRGVVRWRGADDVVVCHDPAGIRSEDTIVVPASYGGLRQGNFDPAATDPVTDRAEQAQAEHRGRAALRIDEHVDPARLGLPMPSTDPDALQDLEGVDEALHGWLATLPDEGWTGRVGSALARALRQRPSRVRVAQVSPDGARRRFVLLGDRPLRGASLDGDATTEGDEGSYTGVAVGLERHLGDVATTAAAFARAVGLPEPLVDDLRRAARLHDLGKADPRFQAMLHGGERVRAARARRDGVLLAKSDLPPGDVATRHRARAASGYPTGERHELLSVALVEAAPALLEGAHDPDLVLHLVASHHGHARPFAPVAEAAPPVEVRITVDGVEAQTSSVHGLARLDRGIPDRFWRLTRRYGWWGLAWMEAILRLADHRASEREQEVLS